MLFGSIYKKAHDVYTVNTMNNDNQLVRFDWAMKYLLRNKANFVILEGFLSELLKRDVRIYQLLESEGNRYQENDKTMRVDVLAELDGGEKVIIEVQSVRQWDYLRRMLYGVSKVVIDHLKGGEIYGRIPRVISINIVYFDLGTGEDYIYKGRTVFKGVHKADTLQLGSEERRTYPGTIRDISDVYPEYYVIKVNQFRNRIQDKFDEWMAFLKDEAITAGSQARGLDAAAETLRMLKLSPEERHQYDRYIDQLRDEKSLVETHYEEGLEKGFEKGEKKKVLEVGRNLKSKGLAIKDIVEITGLSGATLC